jgi:hypothetical protein
MFLISHHLYLWSHMIGAYYQNIFDTRVSWIFTKDKYFFMKDESFVYINVNNRSSNINHKPIRNIKVMECIPIYCADFQSDSTNSRHSTVQYMIDHYIIHYFNYIYITVDTPSILNRHNYLKWWTPL